MDQLIDELEAGLDPEHRALYAPHFAGERQLTRPRMRPRTLVGANARSIPVMNALLPARGLDAVWSQGIGI